MSSEIWNKVETSEGLLLLGAIHVEVQWMARVAAEGNIENRVSSASGDRLHFGLNWPRGQNVLAAFRLPSGFLPRLRERPARPRLPSRVFPSFGNGRPKRRTRMEYLSPQSTEARSDRSKLISESMILLERALPKMLREREGSRNNNGEGKSPNKLHSLLHRD